MPQSIGSQRIRHDWETELTTSYGASLVGQMVKNLPAMWEARVQLLGWEDPLEKGMATHSGILTWRIPWTEEPGGLQSIGLERLLTYQNNLHLKFSVSLFLVCLLFFFNLRLTEKSANSLQSSFFLNHLRLSCQHDVSSSLDNLLCIFLKIETFSYTAG